MEPHQDARPAASTALSVTIVHPVAAIGRRWADEMRARLPGASVGVWPEADPAARFAIGWNPPEGFFEAQPRLEAFFSLGAGVDHVQRNPGLPASLAIVRLEDAGMAMQMAEYCCQEVIRHYRRSADYEAQQRSGTWKTLKIRPRADFGVGVLGLGVLGLQVARAIASFGYPVAGHTRTPRTFDGLACFAGDADLPAFLARSQVLVLMAPLTDATRNLMNAERLAMLPEGAWLVNVARGELIDDAALIDAIDRGHLAGATLDVFRTEPLPPDHPFWRHPRIRLTPHISALTLLDESADQIAGKLLRLASGAPVGGLVDRARGY